MPKVHPSVLPGHFVGNSERTQRERLARFNADDAVNSEEAGINEGVTSNEHYTIRGNDREDRRRFLVVVRLEPEIHSLEEIFHS